MEYIVVEVLDAPIIVPDGNGRTVFPDYATGLKVVNNNPNRIVMPTAGMPKFLLNIDWSELRNQKESLLVIIREYNEDYNEGATVVKKMLAHFQGILHLIDAIQDYVVDEIQIAKEMDVFNQEMDEE